MLYAQRNILTGFELYRWACISLIVLIMNVTACRSLSASDKPSDIENIYNKLETYITMRDGVRLFTSIYIPKDTNTNYPILMQRTPYSVAPYGKQQFKKSLGPGGDASKRLYIYVYQDVRGRHMSEGNFEEMTPAFSTTNHTGTDESTDTYDTIEWLLKNISGTNGNVGIYGISYPGFYATASLPNAHPAIKAVSPQAPVTDEFEGDDVYHRGAFFVMDNFQFLNFFDARRSEPRQVNPVITNAEETQDAYQFFLEAGPIKNLDKYYFKGGSKIWLEYVEHSTKDSYWQKRDIRPQLTNVKPATLVVGGWFDAENLFGALETYKALETQNKNVNKLVMGPWTHGAWAGSEWKDFAGLDFGFNTITRYREIEDNFFDFYLKGVGENNDTEAHIFITGKNEWTDFRKWPPSDVVNTAFYFGADHALTTTVTNGTDTGSFDSYLSDPAHPTPYINQTSGGRIDEYMAADQRFASSRSDVLYFVSTVLEQPTLVTGPVEVRLFASTSGTDADFVVKLIDVEPNGVQRLIRAEILRGKFRNSYEKPQPFIPGQVTPVNFKLNDVAHTFLAGHAIMVQVQSSWFPLTDLNPNHFMNIPDAEKNDFEKATIKIFRSVQHPSQVVLPINTNQ